jgi:hypothetical protein
MRKLSAFCFGLMALGLSACSNVASKLDAAQRDYLDGAVPTVSNSDRTLDRLLAGDKLFQSDEFEKSDQVFQSIDFDRVRSNIAAELKRLAIGQMADDYRPYYMDGLFASYYQLWDMLMLGDFANARVVINNAYERQKRSADEFRKLIKDRKSPDAALDALEKISAESSQWFAYSDIVNPALTYLSGIYFLNIASTNSEWEDARLFLSRANGMLPNSSFISTDLAAANSRIHPRNVAWIFVETSFAPRLVERRIDIPWIFGRAPRIISVATNSPVFADDTASPIGAQMITDVDAAFITEYSEYRINDFLRSAISVAARYAAQGVAMEKDPLLGFAAMIFSAASTTAEIRTWATLPKRIWLVRIPKDDSGLIKLEFPGNMRLEIPVEKFGNDLIYIRSANRVAEPKKLRIKKD